MTRKIFICLFILTSYCACLAQADSPDSLLKVYNQTLNDTLKLSIASRITEYYSETNPDSSLYYANQMQALSQKLGYKINEVRALCYIAYSWLNKGNFPRSLQFLQSALRFAEDPAIEKKVIPVSYLSKEEYLTTEVTPHKMRLSALARAHQFLGVLYSNTNSYEKELLHYRLGIKLAEEAGNIPDLCTNYITAGRVYISLKKPDSAMYYEQKAYDLSMSSGYNKYLGSILLNLGRIQSMMGNKQRAFDYFHQAVNASAAQKYLRGVVAANLYLSELYRQDQKPDSSLSYARNALKVAEELKASSLLLRSYSSLAAFYRAEKNNDSTVKYQELVIKMNDSLFNTKQVQQFENLDFDEEQRRQEMANAKKDYEQRLQQYLLLGGLLAALVVAIVLFRSNRQRHRTNVLLRRQKTEIENTLQELKNTQKQLVQSEKMASLGELTAGIAHEIQNPLNFVNNFSELNTELISDMREELKAGNIESAGNISKSIEENEAKILEHGKRAETIVKNMLQHSRSNSGKKEPTDINALIREYLRLSFHGLRAKDKTFTAKTETNLDPSLPLLNIVPQEIGRVILNLLNNAFYAVAEKKKTTGGDFEPFISVTTKQAGSNAVILIRDNGNGIDKKDIEKIFQPFYTTKPPGLGTGLGLSLSYDIIKAHGGEIKPETVKGEGTTFIILLPTGNA